MKKIVPFILALAMLFGFNPTVKAKEVNFRLFLDGKVIAIKSGIRIEDDSMMIPFAPVFKQLGFKIHVDPDIKERITISNKTTTITFIVGAKNIYLNGKEIKMPTNSKVYNGTTYLPLRSIAQALGKGAGSNSKDNYAWIGNKPTSVPTLPPEMQGKDFRNAVWGMTVKQVKKLETLSLINYLSELDEYGLGDTYYTYMTYQGKYFDYNSHFIYTFAGKKKNEGKLYHGQILFTDRFTDMQDYIDRFFEISSKMESVYGSPIKRDYYASTDNREKWAAELSLNKLSLEDKYSVGRNQYYIRLSKNLYSEYPQLDILVSEK